MLTDRLPRNKQSVEEFEASDRLRCLEVPPDDRLRRHARSIEASMQADRRSDVRAACAEFLRVASDFYSVPRPEIRVLAACPIRARQGGWAVYGTNSAEPQSLRSTGSYESSWPRAGAGTGRGIRSMN
jgi:hypothetical protein